jgi:hypothetical protein
MYRCLVQDRTLLVRAYFCCGCYDIIREVVEYAKGPNSFFTAGSIETITERQAFVHQSLRLDQETELIDRVAAALARRMKEAV